MAQTFLGAAASVPAPGLDPIDFNNVRLIVNPGDYPTQPPNDTVFALRLTVTIPADSPHNGKYLTVSGDMGGASAVPVWKTYSEWGGSNGVQVRNLLESSEYNFQTQVKVATTTFSSSAALYVTSPTEPKLSWKKNLTQGSWINLLITSFTAKNSSHYHYRFNQDPYDAANLTSQDRGYQNGEVVVVTATAEGPWFFHSLGDTFGFRGSPNHALVGTSRFELNVDTTPPAITRLSAQYSAFDPTKIENGSVTPHAQPYFKWESPILNPKTESPIQGYSFLFSTGSDPGDGAVPLVVQTTANSIDFPVQRISERENQTLYFRVKALDLAGNWGPSALFSYRVVLDGEKPKPMVQPISTVKGDDGRFLAVKGTPKIQVRFSEDLKVNTVLSTQNVIFSAIRDHAGNRISVSRSVNLTYDAAGRLLELIPVGELEKGWLYQVVLTTAVLDLAMNPLEKETRILFETTMDSGKTNHVLGSDGKTKVVVPPNALPEDVSISVTLVSGGIYPAQGLVPVSPALRYTSPSSLSAANEKIQSLLGSFAQPVTVREFAALNANGQIYSSNFRQPVTITLPYVDLDGDGIVDLVTPKAPVKKLSVYVLDEENSIWVKVPGSVVDTTNQTISIPANHFSVYALLGAPDNDVSQSYAYPVPFRPSQGHTKITFANLPSEGNIRIYTVDGELAKKIDFVATSGESKKEWDVKNDDGEEMASDVYLYVIESGSNQRKGKLVVVR
ncbi:MAG: Ig-like domain-containing protein [Elusimicrobia bacterium]|nr:Ig-like domain-containing protein [Elusimicrobiota bacterium]